MSDGNPQPAGLPDPAYWKNVINLIATLTGLVTSVGALITAIALLRGQQDTHQKLDAGLEKATEIKQAVDEIP